MLPALCEFYGIKPWEIDLLTYREAEQFVDHLVTRVTQQAQLRGALGL